jgi:probable F420-dependent oxidoreductase
MGLAQRLSLGTVLPHRSPDPIAPDEIRNVARRAEALGFRDLWVTENTLDHSYSFDAFVILTYAAAATSSIRLGTAVVALPVHHPIHVAHSVASLDHLSRGRVTLGVGLGRESHYHEFQVPVERRVRRLRESIELMKALWTQDRVDYAGEIYHAAGAQIRLKPVQQPHPPVWLGGTHPDAIVRAASIADGWMGSGNQSTEAFGRAVPLLLEALEKRGRDPAAFPISKRVFMYVDERPEAARSQVERWFAEAYRNPRLTDSAGLYGTPSQVAQRLEELASMGANHLLLNTVFNYEEQLDALAEVTGLSRGRPPDVAAGL